MADPSAAMPAAVPESLTGSEPSQSENAIFKLKIAISFV
jgi:hypothetical protein